jgi:hypothetical protein
MKSFYRIKRDSGFLSFIGLAFALSLSMLFTIIGFGINAEDRFDWVVGWVFGIAGIALFIIFFRGAWMITKGNLTPSYLQFREYCGHEIWRYVAKKCT